MKYELRMPQVEAIQYLREDNISSVQNFFEKDPSTFRCFRYLDPPGEYALAVKGKTVHVLQKGEWILREPDGSFVVMDPVFFEKNYRQTGERMDADGQPNNN